MYVKYRSHMTTPKIWNCQLNYHWRMKISYLYRSKTQRFRNVHNKVENGMYNEFYCVKNNVLFGCIVDNGPKFKARVIPDCTGRHSAASRPQPVWTQWVSEEICSNQACLYYLERYENTNFAILQTLQGLCSTKMCRRHSLKNKSLSLVYNQWNL